MSKSAPTGMKIVLALNCVALVGFAVLLWVQLEFTDLDVQMNYTQLDRAGVINNDALGKFHPDYGFAENPRYSVPRYIAGPACQAQLVNAMFGVALSAVNLVIVGGFLIAARWSASAKAEAEVPRQ